MNVVLHNDMARPPPPPPPSSLVLDPSTAPNIPPSLSAPLTGPMAVPSSTPAASTSMAPIFVPSPTPSRYIPFYVTSVGPSALPSDVSPLSTVLPPFPTLQPHGVILESHPDTLESHHEASNLTIGRSQPPLHNSKAPSTAPFMVSLLRSRAPYMAPSTTSSPTLRHAKSSRMDPPPPPTYSPINQCRASDGCSKREELRELVNQSIAHFEHSTTWPEFVNKSGDYLGGIHPDVKHVPHRASHLLDRFRVQ
jgi:hypothetical protein